MWEEVFLTLWLFPHPKGLTWEYVAAPVKVSYPGWIWKILVLYETLTRALNGIGQWRKNLWQLLCPAPTSTSLPVPYFRSFSLRSRDLSSKVANLFSAYHTTTPFPEVSNHKDKPFKRWAGLQFVEQLSYNASLQASWHPNKGENIQNQIPPP